MSVTNTLLHREAERPVTIGQTASYASILEVDASAVILPVIVTYTGAFEISCPEFLKFQHKRHTRVDKPCEADAKEAARTAHDAMLVEAHLHVLHLLVNRKDQDEKKESDQ
mmetsp:Transcript_103621/g.184100  ORF Transcript_103621/g.184100 Transcript_103621/m.184100 type:complete len:111 (-) Transcript_103621:147-479(-)|eukprot:CAMPEP_0197713482 /NCGR_PEP_ID=MMETSP1338-20131121/130481_1 /TAXON_ID=43686 ORGANISM="Pelagodinium beii, Strain RCC1491" /NCGR_SAMPLE_ID=MMETSP1338 /ASSEMBLY_ACC=CAM_ASM_000754 /LENGTH=110 /DNA_ID=CAMNT_0043297423 /DNA_START=421 /DNA_END=753 /DNA_ORIENTATION=+